MVGRTITFRFPAEIIEAIEARAKATQSNRTAVVMEALVQAYGFPSTTSVSPCDTSTTATTSLVTTDTIQGQLSRLEQTVSALLAQLAESTRELDPPQAVATDSRTEENRELPDPTFSQHGEIEVRQLDQILSATPDLIFTQDRLGRFTYLNTAGARIWGFDRSHFLGKTLEELGFLREVEALLAPQREAVFATGQPMSGDVSIPTLYETRDYEYILSPIQGIGSTIDAVVCTARDITERNQAEKELRKSEEKYRNLFEFANDSIFIVDLATNKLLNANQNAARRLGYTRRELLQQTLQEIESPSATHHREQLTMLELQKSGSAVYEHTLRRKDGTEIAVEISSRVIEYDDCLALQNFVRDISERKATEARLRLLESAMSDTSSNPSDANHYPSDKRNP